MGEVKEVVELCVCGVCGGAKLVPQGVCTWCLCVGVLGVCARVLQSSCYIE